MNKLETWAYALIKTVIGGAATAGSSWLGLTVGKAAGIDLPTLNFKALGWICLSGAMTNLFFYLKQSPLPDGSQPPAPPSAKLPLLLAFCVGLAALPACKSSSLQPGGAYAPTNSVPAVQPDYTFFIIDSAFDLAYSSIDATFKFERDNRTLLWKVSPNIKHSLDQLRPQAAAVTKEYLTARAAYMANPVPAGLTALQSALAKLQQLATTATALLPKK